MSSLNKVHVLQVLVCVKWYMSDWLILHTQPHVHPNQSTAQGEGPGTGIAGLCDAIVKLCHVAVASDVNPHLKNKETRLSG